LYFQTKISRQQEDFDSFPSAVNFGRGGGAIAPLLFPSTIPLKIVHSNFLTLQNITDDISHEVKVAAASLDVVIGQSLFNH